ncbi:sugar phosphate isomerase/epimerase family protein [Haloarcula argentinensis]|uniref:Sugar phosphate isomerase n=1 Tax=Haloarcula argentinensis TaxID=43776 RepID=A0A830FGS0_HALAR|nr:sugar phosphate isomerase/epimerase [Haloarcula argentinensis]GGM22830.1 sugar phosphate isomerase [Haloarcula argentinensis]
MGSGPNTAIQLYSIRTLSEPLPEIVRRVGTAGYDGVEFAHRFHEEPPKDVAAALDDVDLEPVAVHADLPDIEAALDGESDLLVRCRTVGCDTLVIPHLSASEFRTRSDIRSLSHRLCDVAAGLEACDMQLGYHTGRQTFRPFLPDAVGKLIDGTPIPAAVGEYTHQLLTNLRATDQTTIPSETPAWNLLARTTPAELTFEPEVAEICEAGYDPTALLSLCGERINMVHLRDVAPIGPFRGYTNVPHGEGVVDMEAVLDAASDAGVDWVIYENELDNDPTAKIDHGTATLERLLDGSKPSRSSTRLPATSS